MTPVQPSGLPARALITDQDVKAAADVAFPGMPSGMTAGEETRRVRAALDAVAPALHDRWVAEALERLAVCWRPESDVRAAILANAAEYRATGPQARTEATT